MRSCDVLIVGGGPAGSSAAWRLREAGADVVVLDRDAFPRLKLCAGWITPEVVDDLEIDIAAYPHRFLTFDRLHLYLKGVHVPVRCVQHSIRRYEFDAWLLVRSAAEVVRHNVRNIRHGRRGYVVDDAFEGSFLIGAGGTRCPVYREIFREANPRARELQTVTLEHELEWDWQDGDCHLWFFDHGLPGYAWYVPKSDGWINVGIGGMAERIKQGREDIREHWQRFVAKLDRKLLPQASYEPAGYSYYLRGNVDVVRVENAFIAGDAVGLATRDLCEGIGPAVRSGILAARSIAGDADYSLHELARYSGDTVVSRWLERGFTGSRPH